jgi:hypothetical protein
VKLTQRIMRIIAPVCEKQRMEFRAELARVEANTEDLLRTLKITPQQMQALREAQKK